MKKVNVWYILFEDEDYFILDLKINYGEDLKSLPSKIFKHIDTLSKTKYIFNIYRVFGFESETNKILVVEKICKETQLQVNIQNEDTHLMPYLKTIINPERSH